MTEKSKKGAAGEAEAVKFLRNQGYDVLETNWRYSYSEVDIICRKEDLLIFVEVKTRQYREGVHPEDAVGYAKQQNLYRAAQHYIDEQEHVGELRFDVVAVELKGHRHYVHHIPDAFYPYHD